MNKQVIGTIVGAALLGLAKSKGSLAKMNRFHHTFKKNIKKLRSKYPPGEAFDITLEIVLERTHPYELGLFISKDLIFYIEKTSEYLSPEMKSYVINKTKEKMDTYSWLDIFAYLAGSPEVRKMNIPIEFEKEGQMNKIRTGSMMYYTMDSDDYNPPTTISFIDSPTGLIYSLKEGTITQSKFDKAMSFFLKEVPLDLFNSIYIDVVNLLKGKSLVTDQINADFNSIPLLETEDIKYFILGQDMNSYHDRKRNYGKDVRDRIIKKIESNANPINPRHELEADVNSGQNLKSYIKRVDWLLRNALGYFEIVGDKSFFEQIISQKILEFNKAIVQVQKERRSNVEGFSLENYGDFTELYNKYIDKIRYIGDLDIEHSISGDDVQVFLVEYLDDQILIDLGRLGKDGKDGKSTCLSTGFYNRYRNFGILLRMGNKIYVGLHLIFHVRRGSPDPMPYSKFNYCQNATSNEGTLGKNFGFHPYVACETALGMLPIDWSK